MDTEKPNIIMHKPKKPLLSKFNECLTCKLCKGYIIDATTIIECSHSFCRSCIVKYLESNKYCPSCDVQVHKTRPLLNIRPDKILQNLVYKLVPRLYHNEIKKRTLYYETHPSAKISIFEKNMLAQYEYILSPDELVDISLHYYGCSTSLRFIRCSCAVTVSHIIRLINAKYDLTDQHKVEVLYDQDILNSSNSLMEIAYIYSWKKDSPLDLAYKIYENRIKKPRLEHSDNDVDSFVSRNNNNWKEVQLRISETGEMSITGIQDANLLEMLNNEAKFNNEVVINEGKNLEDDEIKKNTQLLKDAETKSTNKTDIEVIKKEIPDLKLISEISSIKNSNKTNNNSMGHLSITKVSSTPNLNLISSSISTTISKIGKLSSSLPASKTMELSEALNLNSELSVIPLNANSSCVSLSSCGTTTVYSTINKTMCSTKSDDNNYRESSNVNNISEIKDLTMTTILKQSNCLKRKCEDIEKSSPISSKLPKPTILNHTIGLINLSNHHPLKKHLKLNKNGDRRQTDVTVTSSVHSPTTTVSSDPNKYTIIKRSFTPVNKKLGQSTKGLPCYMLKSQSSVKNTEKNGEKMETNQQQKPEQISQTKSQHLHHVHHHTPIITPSQLPHHQNSSQMMRQTTKETGSAEKQNQENHTKNEPSTTTTTITSETNHQSSNISDVISTVSTNNSLLMPTAKSKSNTHHHSLGYKTLRDPPKSWNAQINSQIARDKRNVKAQQLVLCEANNAAAAAAGGKSAGDLKNVRPAKFFKGRQVPRYLGNPASGVKPLYQLYSNPEKDKPMQDASANVVKPLEKSEIKKHSIVNVDPKTLKPISEKAPETLNLSNLSSSSSSSVHLTSTTLELRINPTMMSDLKINTSSVSIFNPLKLQQNSPKNERRSPKSPHSPKIKAIANASTVSTSSSSSSSLTPATTTTINTLSPKQQRDKTSLTFTPSNPFIPNLASPTLNPNQFIYPAGGFPSYDPRVMAAYHHIWYSQRIAAAGLTNLPPGLTGTHPFGLNMALNSPTSMASPSSSSSSQQQISPGVSSKHSAAKSPSSPRTSSGSSPQQSKSSSVTKKLKDSPTATANNKSDKSLESALEKITKVNKELEEKNKELKIELKKESLNENSGADNRRNSTNKSSKLELLKDSISETEKKTVEKTVDECKEKSETVCCSDEKKCEEVKIDTVNGITIEVPQENGKENVDNVEKLVSEEKSLEVPIKECKDNNLTDSKDEEISLEKKSEPVTLPELDEEEKRESPENLSSENVKVTENVTDESVHELPVINIDDKISHPVNNKNSTTKEEEEEKEKEVKIDEKVVEISSTAESKNNKCEELKENLESLETENVDAESVSS